MKQVGWQGARPLSIWTLSDGRAGIAAQAQGLAEAIAHRTPATITGKQVQLRTPWRWLPPGFVPLPRQALTDTADPIEPPWPDLAIGCGRQAVPFAMGLRSWSEGRTFVVQLQDPRVNPREFDLVVPPTHDDLTGPTVLPILGPCHRVTPERIAAEAAQHALPPAAPGQATLAVLIGGKSKRQDISPRRAAALSQALVALSRREGARLLVTVSRRTGAPARAAFAEQLKPHAALYYEGSGPNPYFALLAAADAIAVTADSVNMAAEAAATGAPVLLLPVDGPVGKLAGFHADLVDRGCARWFTGGLERWTYEPLRETDRVAAVVLDQLRARLSDG